MTAGKPYDATAKELLQTDPAGWATFLGVPRPPERVKLIDTELSTVTAAADKVLRIEDDSPWILDVEFQSWSDPGAPRQLLMYNALLQEKYALPVASVLVVLAEKARSSAYTGRLIVAPPLGPAWEFAYTVIRVWELPAERILAGPLAVLPLAPMADVTGVGLPEVAARIGRRLRAEADPRSTDEVISMLGVLMKLRYDAMATEEFLRSIPDIEEYPAFKIMLDRGRVRQARSGLLRVGRKKFGPPTAEQEAAVNAITDLARLESLSEKLLDVSTWDELLKPD